MDEKQRVNKVLRGDTAAFGYFVDTYQDMAITIAYRVCNSRQDAEDIVQNAFVKCFHNLHTFRSDCKFSTWFYRIVYNTAISHIKSAVFSTEFVDYKQLETVETISEWDTIASIEERERKQMINEALEKLPADESLLLTLYYLEENAVKDIVQITGLTESNVKVKLHRARQHLASLLCNTLKSETIL